MKTLVTLLVATSLFACLQSTAQAQPLKPVVFFDGSKNEYPESIAIDQHGNLYLSLFFAGKIKKVSPEGVQTDFAQIDDWSLLGLTFDREGNLVIAGGKGIWKVLPDGTPKLFSPVTGNTYLNDLTYDQHGNLYVTDDFLIWKIDPQGNAVMWTSDPLLRPSATFFPFEVGGNGIRFTRDMRTLHVSNTSAGRVLAIDVRPDGSAAPARILAESTLLIGADGIEIDEHDNTFVAVNYQDRIAKVSREGRITTVVEGGALSCPTSLVLGRARTAHTLFICNNGNVFFSSDPVGEGLLSFELKEGDPRQPLPRPLPIGPGIPPKP